MDAEVKKEVQKVGQEQIHTLLFSDKLSWQEIIYDLINTEQLDPWDINIVLLANKFLDRIKMIEESNFFISSKVLLAAALLLRMKSEILLQRDLPLLDNRLFGREEEEKKYIQERIELDEDIPALILKTPLPRFKKVTLEELMKALNNAITTENRRIKKIVVARQQEFETGLSLPKRKINIQDRIKEVYKRLIIYFDQSENKLAFSDLVGMHASEEDKISTFVPLLHLDTQHKVWLEQNAHFEEIWILLKHLYEKQNKEILEQMKKEAQEEMQKLTEEEKIRADEVEEQFSNPLGSEI